MLSVTTRPSSLLLASRPSIMSATSSRSRTDGPAGSDAPASALGNGGVVESGLDFKMGTTPIHDYYVMKGVFAAAKDLAPEQSYGSDMTYSTKALTERELLEMEVDTPYMTSDEDFPHGFADVDPATGEERFLVPPVTGLIQRIYRDSSGSYCMQWLGKFDDAVRFYREERVSLSMANWSSEDAATGKRQRGMMHVAILPKGTAPAWEGSYMTSAAPLMPDRCTSRAVFEQAKVYRRLKDEIGRTRAVRTTATPPARVAARSAAPKAAPRPRLRVEYADGHCWCIRTTE